MAARELWVVEAGTSSHQPSTVQLREDASMAVAVEA
jgi:hypothetical protein